MIDLYNGSVVQHKPDPKLYDDMEKYTLNQTVTQWTAFSMDRANCTTHCQAVDLGTGLSLTLTVVWPRRPDW